MKEVWADEHARWLKRDLSAKRYVYFWVDGIYVHALADEAQCLLVIIGATPEARRNWSARRWPARERAILARCSAHLKRRGLSTPQLAIGDGALGFWKALDEVWPNTQCNAAGAQDRQRAQQAANSLHAKAKRALHDIYANQNAPSRLRCLYQTYAANTQAECLSKSHTLLTFYTSPLALHCNYKPIKRVPPSINIHQAPLQQHPSHIFNSPTPKLSLKLYLSHLL